MRAFLISSTTNFAESFRPGVRRMGGKLGRCDKDERLLPTKTIICHSHFRNFVDNSAGSGCIYTRTFQNSKSTLFSVSGKTEAGLFFKNCSSWIPSKPSIRELRLFMTYVDY